MVKHEGVPAKEVSAASLVLEYSEAIQYNQKLDLDTKVLALRRADLANAQKLVSELKATVEKESKALKGTAKIDANSIQAKIEKSDRTNAQIRENASYKTTEAEVNKLRKESRSLSDKMAKIVAEKEKTLSEAKFPIKGLGVDGDEVVFGGAPFDQCSSAQQIKVSVAMGLVMNPKLRILLIREGSLLDAKSLKMVAKMAEKADAQIWMERVSRGKECSVILEDGSVVEQEVSNV